MEAFAGQSRERSSTVVGTPKQRVPKRAKKSLCINEKKPLLIRTEILFGGISHSVPCCPAEQRGLHRANKQAMHSQGARGAEPQEGHWPTWNPKRTSAIPPRSSAAWIRALWCSHHWAARNHRSEWRSCASAVRVCHADSTKRMRTGHHIAGPKIHNDHNNQ